MLESSSQAAAGTVVAAGPDGIDVACSQGTLRLLEVQLDGKKRVDAAAFLSGHPLPAGSRLSGSE